MNKETILVVLMGTALAASVAPSIAGQDRGDRFQKGGAVVRCSLDGVNPAYHRDIFGNPAAAASYGFVQSRDGIWHVAPNCHP